MKIDSLEVLNDNGTKLGTIVTTDDEMFQFAPENDLVLTSGEIRKIADIIEQLEYFCVQNNLNVE